MSAPVATPAQTHLRKKYQQNRSARIWKNRPTALLRKATTANEPADTGLLSLDD